MFRTLRPLFFSGTPFVFFFFTVHASERQIYEKRLCDGKALFYTCGIFKWIFLDFSSWEYEEKGGSTRKRIFPPLPKILLCTRPRKERVLPSRCKKCKSQQPSSRTACLITVAAQPGMLAASGRTGLQGWCCLQIGVAVNAFFFLACFVHRCDQVNLRLTWRQKIFQL